MDDDGGYATGPDLAERATVPVERDGGFRCYVVLSGALVTGSPDIGLVHPNG